MELPKFCPQCQGSYLRSIGRGIEKLESEMIRFYPQAKVVLFDKEMEALPSSWDIIVSTQAILKFKNQLRIDLAAVVEFDDELNRFDFRCAHHAFALLVYLRQMAREKVMVQTKMMDSYCLKAHQPLDFSLFYKEELALRKELNLPPSRDLVGIYLRGESEVVVWQQADELCRQLKKELLPGVEMTDPHTDLVAKLRDKYRLTIMLKGKSSTKMISLVHQVLKSFKKKNVIIAVDGNP